MSGSAADGGARERPIVADGEQRERPIGADGEQRERPISADDLRARLASVIEEARAAGRLDEVERWYRELTTTLVSPSVANAAIPMRFGMVGDSPPMRAVFALLERVTQSDVSVLVNGETGTGKELVARALHEFGKRKSKPFLAENCAAVPANLLESELFGHAKGSFTGAVAERKGHFVTADGGTVFLDEIGDMPLAMQSKLLRVLQDGEVRPVGSNKVQKVDVRIVAATNKDLVAMCKAGTFREDLYFRLNVVTIVLPPLRERTGDVAHLVRFYLKRIGDEMKKPVDITPEALALLERWRWPGNVRELDNVVRRAAVFARGAITPADIGPPIVVA